MSKRRHSRHSHWGLLFLMAALTIMLYVTYRHYRGRLPEFPDNSRYETLEERATAALKVARRHGLNTDYCLMVDYSVPSGTPRLYMWSFKTNEVKARTYVMHGPGRGSTAEKPVFSNRPGSNCSALGRFIVTRSHGSKIKRSYRMRGLDLDNQTAWQRGLMIHRSTWVDRHCGEAYIPLHPVSCQGCVTVSSRGMDYLEQLIEGEERNLLLWSFCSGSM